MPETTNARVQSSVFDDILYQFEKDYRAGKNPEPKAYLTGEGENRWRLLLELLHSNLELRLRAGETLYVKDYLQKYPELAQRPGDILSLLAVELRFLNEQGQKPVLEEYEQDYGKLIPSSLKSLFEQPSPKQTDFNLGKLIANRYRLIKVLGQGGMGTVYLAEQSDPVKRQVALKLIKTGVDSRQYITRFEAERQALAVMDHPNIARVYDGGTTEQHQPYFVMELVQGTPITQYCDQHRLSPKVRLELFVLICQAVQHAHQKGIIHRDLKPGNVLVTEVDGKPVPKVIDFGLAKATEQPLTDETIEEQGIVGTPAYMSPEQADPDNPDVDTRTDVYALGVILYELLTGSTPIEARQFRRGAVLEMLRMVREEEPPRPSTKLSSAEELPSIAANRDVEPKQLLAWVRGDIEWIIMKSLEKDRNRRYETANGFAADVQRYLCGEPVLAHPPSRWYRAKKFVKRNKVQVVAVGLVVMTLVVALVISLWQMNRAIDAEELAIINEDRAKKERKTSLAVRDIFMNKIILQADPKEQARQTKLLGIQGDIDSDPRMSVILKRASLLLSPAKINSLIPDDPVLQAELLYVVGVTYRNSCIEGDIAYEASLELLRRAQDIQQKHLGKESMELLQTQNEIAWTLRLAGKPLESVELYRYIFNKYKDMITCNIDTKFLLLDNYCVSLIDAHSVKQDVTLVNEAINILQSISKEKSTLYGDESPSTLLTLHRLAMAYHANKSLEIAESINREVLIKRIRTLGHSDPFTLETRQNLGQVLRTRGKYKEAIEILNDVYKDMVDVYGASNPQATLIALGNLSGALVSSKQYDKAIEKLKLLLDLRVVRMGARHPHVFTTLSMLGQAYEKSGNIGESIKYYCRAVECIENGKLLYNDSNNVVKRLSLLYETNGKWESSLNLRMDMLNYVKERYGRESGEYHEMQVGIGRCLIRIDRLMDAESHLRIYLDTKQQKSTAWLYYYAESLLGEVLFKLKKYDEAEKILLNGYDGLVANEKNIPTMEKGILIDTISNIAKYYTQNNQPNKAKKWQALLDIHDVNMGVIKNNWLIKHYKDIVSTVEETPTMPSNDSWQPIKIGKSWNEQGYSYHEGSVWYRLDLLIPNTLKQGDYFLQCGGIDDYGDLFLDGEYIGTMGDMYLGRSAYSWPAQFTLPDLKPGIKYQLAVRVVNWSGSGGIHRPMTLSQQPLDMPDAYRSILSEYSPRFKEEMKVAKPIEANLYSYRENMAVAYENLNELQTAETLLRENVNAVRLAKCGERFLSSAALALAVNLSKQNKWAEAETLFRECYLVQEKQQPLEWRTKMTAALLGEVQLALKKYSEAEQFLLSGYQGMKRFESAMPPHYKSRITEALDRLIQLYTETNKPEEMKKWQAERAKYPAKPKEIKK